MPKKNMKLNVAFITKVKQEDIYAALRKRGWNQTRAAKELQMPPNVFNDMINLVRVPKYSDGLNHKLVKLTGKGYKELFPFSNALEKTFGGEKFSVIYGVCDLERIDMSAITRSPTRSLEDEIGLRDVLEHSISNLSEQKREVLHLRYAQDLSVEEIALELNLSRERIRQILNNAIGDLRVIFKTELGE